MKAGKIENELLSKYLKKIKNDNTVVQSPKIGLDCGVIDINGQLLAITTDPITSVVNDISTLGIEVNLNDLYAQGATPYAFTCTLLMPTTSHESELENIFHTLINVCEKEHINLVSGHTEVTDAVTRPVLSITAIGTLEKDTTIYNIKEGDVILFTKGLAIEGSLILSEAYFDKLSPLVGSDNLHEFIEQYKNKLSVKKESLIARKYKARMHDITEGGILGGLYEVLTSENLGCDISFNTKDIHPITKVICDTLNIDVYKLMSSGSMLIITDENDAVDLINDLVDNNIEVFNIGKVLDGCATYKVDDTSFTLTNNERDELYKVL